jgi:hypothetical protein
MIEVGSRVKYIRNDTPEDRASGFYPPRGTLGKVVEVFEDTVRVQWDFYTKGNGLWFCGYEDVEVVYAPSSGMVMAIRLYLLGHTPMAELAFSDRSCVTIEWANSRERAFYAPLITAYTLIYDERLMAEFKTWRKEEHK